MEREREMGIGVVGESGTPSCNCYRSRLRGEIGREGVMCRITMSMSTLCYPMVRGERVYGVLT
jgi:hypothetical protein